MKKPPLWELVDLAVFLLNAILTAIEWGLFFNRPSGYRLGWAVFGSIYILFFLVQFLKDY